MSAGMLAFTICCGLLGGLCLLGFFADAPGLGFIGVAFIVGVIVVDTGTVCTDMTCKYANLTTGRVAQFCAPRGGVQAIQWNDDTAICKDGTLRAFRTGYYRGEAPRP